MNDREYKRLRATIEAEYLKKIDALELIYGMASRNAVSATSVPVRGELAQAVLSAIQQQETDFTVRDIQETLKVMHSSMTVKRGSLSNTLKRLLGSEIELIEKGSGKRPSTYRRKPRVG